MSINYTCRKAESSDVPKAAAVFIQSFREELHMLYGRDPKPEVMIDAVTFWHYAEGDGFLVAENEDKELVGYIFVCKSLKKLQWKFLTGGYAFKWIWGLLSGRYGIPFRVILRMMGDKFSFLGSSQQYRSSGDAQVVNIAVSPAFQGKGMGRFLMNQGIAYLEKEKVKELRLEVRPDNIPAVELYKKLGFLIRGKTQDSKGSWYIMTKKLGKEL